jgi:hypothetical protein
MANPSGKGGFEKGRSGNPGGRPKVVASLQLEARRHMHAALKVLIDIARKGKSEASRVAAATALLDRGFGRPTQSLEMTLDAGLITKRLTELSDAELATLEARVRLFGAQGDLFDSSRDGGPGPHGAN